MGNTVGIDSKQVKRYKKNERIYKGEHKDLFAGNLSLEDKDRYMTVNLIKPAFRDLSNLYVSSNPTPVVQSEEAQEWLDTYIKNNKIQSKLFDMIISMLTLGGLVVRTGVRTSKKNKEIEIYTEFVHPRHLEVIQDPWDQANPIGYRLIFENQIGQVQYKRIEEYRENSYEISRFIKDKNSTTFRLVGEVEQVNHDAGMLIHYMPFNRDPFEFYGRSAIEDVEDLIKEINNRFTFLKRVNDIFAAPKLMLPPTIFKQFQKSMGWDVKMDQYGSEYVTFANQDVFCFNPSVDGQMPEYLTWDADTESAFKFLFTVTMAMSTILGVPSHSLRIEEGNYPESGKALTLRYLPSLTIIKNLQTVVSDTMEMVYWQAQKLAYQYGQITFAPEWVTVFHFSSLPLDEESVIAEISKYQAGLQSKETTMQKLDNLNARQLEEELRKINEESSNDHSHENDYSKERDLTALLGLSDSKDEKEEVNE